MKNFKTLIHICIAGVLACISIYTLAAEKNVSGKLNQVNVFLNGAQLFHTATVQIPAGTSSIYLEGISPYVQANSIQAGGKGEFIIMDVEHYIHYPEPISIEENSLPLHIKKEIKLLEDSLLNLGYDIELLSDKKNLLLTEKNIINNNKLYKGEGKSDSLQLFSGAMEFYHKKLTEINTELLKIKKEEHVLIEKRTRQQGRLNELKNYSNTQIKNNKNNNQPTHKIKLSIMAENPVLGNINVNYFIANAGWNPIYDIRAINTESPVKLTYKAQVRQNSGIDWNGVKLVLSTSNPQKNNNKPYLNPWYLSFYNVQRHYYDKRNQAGQAQAPSAITKEEKSKATADMEMDALSIADYTQITEALVNVQYDIKLPCTIPNDGKNHSITVLQKEITTNYEYRAVPKLDPDAFIMARISGWDDLNLLSAKANVYFENMYVGETFINADVTNDTLEVALGRDNSIQVTRKKVKTNEKEKFINDQKVLSYAYEISVRNGKNSNIRLVIEDQIPLSNNQQIKVELSDSGKADVNQNSGMLTWDLKLKAKETKNLKYAFIIKHDKDKQLSMLP
jgi:uncharacterized protein (TIGR02231 family)